jgi:hypothetical protein
MDMDDQRQEHEHEHIREKTFLISDIKLLQSGSFDIEIDLNIHVVNANAKCSGP